MKNKITKIPHTDSLYMFNCPGCGRLHAISAVCGSESRGNAWKWNGSVTAPTFEPSLLSHWNEKGIAQVCHSFIRDGKIQFLSDCTHALAGQTVEMVDAED